MMGGDLSAQPIDILVVDFFSLIDAEGQPIISRISLLPSLYEYFDLKIWRESSLKSRLFKPRYSNLFKLYEFDFAEFLYLREKQLKIFLKLNNSLLLTSRENLAGRFGSLCINQWASVDFIAHIFDLEITRK